MAGVQVFEAGGYRFVEGVFQYSGGVAAQPGFEIERARFARPLPLADAYAAVEAHLMAIGRPSTAFAACELRSPAPFSDRGFYEFNKVYVQTLARWGIYRDGDRPVNPVARTNVCPMYGPPAAPLMYAFSYTVPAAAGRTPRGSFILAGSGDAKNGDGSFESRIVRLNDASPEAMRDKVDLVLGEMARRLTLLGMRWEDAARTHAYTVLNIGHLVGEVFAARGTTPAGLGWVYARPPVVGLDFEMDVHGPARDILL